jgi:hypothetical protein
VILVDEAAEDVEPMDVERRGSDDCSVAGRRNTEADASVRTLFVVVADVLAKNPVQVTTAENDYPAEALCPHCPYPALRVGIFSWRSDWRLDHPDALRAENFVEAGGELGVSIADEELDGMAAVSEITNQIAGHLGDERSVRVIGDTEDVHLRVASSITKST